ncbi:MAG: hypothetical protein MHPSP_002681 [Paramarteilia canceri]
MAKEDYYDVLGIDKSASQEEIKKAYRRLAQQYHPDRAPSGSEQEFTDKFTKISEAYQVLIDPEKKKKYDTFGFVDGHEMGPGGFEHYNDLFQTIFGSQGMGNFSMSFGGEDMNFGGGRGSRSPFESMFSGMGGGRPRQSKKSAQPLPKGQPISHDLELTLEEFYFGTEKNRKITRRRANGQREELYAKVTVNPGMKPNTKFTFHSYGDETESNSPGDIIFVLKQKEHKIFKREGDNIIITVNVELKEAFEPRPRRYRVTNIDSKEIDVTIPQNEIITNKTVKVFPSYGMPISKIKGKRGDLLVKFDVNIPDKLPEQQRIAIVSSLTNMH